MELKEGMYVRTKWGYICKLININDFREPSMKYGVEANYLKDIMFIGDDDILKASHNIIDLIECGDYVNGEKVIRIDKDPFIKGQINLWTNTTTSNYWGDISLSPIIESEIKSIVTKQQFESMQYEVK